MAMIYGVNSEGDVTPIQVRDAILSCFYEAHCSDAQLGLDDKNMNRNYCKAIVKKAFTDIGADFENPTKEDLKKVIDGLAEFAKSFRNPELIEEHYNEIMSLIEKLK